MKSKAESANAKTVALMKHSKFRMISKDNSFWAKLDCYLNTEVRDSHRSNGIRFAPCCWTFLKRRAGGYIEHPITISLASCTQKKETFLTAFEDLAEEYRFAYDGKVAIPFFNQEHLGIEEEPALEDKLKEVPPAEGGRKSSSYYRLSIPDSRKMSEVFSDVSKPSSNLN